MSVLSTSSIYVPYCHLFYSPVAFLSTFAASESFTLFFFLIFLYLQCFLMAMLHILSPFKRRPFCPPPPGHGYCSCGRCICEKGWFGKLCQFPRSCDMSDAQSKGLCETSDGVICSGKGEHYFLLFGGVWKKHF